MNLLITRTKQEHTNVWWEPFATSTPLKSVPDNLKAKFENQSQKQPLTNDQFVNFGEFKGFGTSSIFQSGSTESKNFACKKVRKSKSCAYFDLSSSSDDDDDLCEKKGLIIKLSTKKNTKSLIGNKKPKNDETELVNKVIQQKDDSCKKINNISFNNKKKSSVVDLKLKNGRNQNVKNKAKNTCENVKTKVQIQRIQKKSCDQLDRIFDESTCKKNSVKEIKPSLLNKENISCSKSDLINNLIKNEETELKEMPKILGQPVCKYNNRSQSQKSLVKVATQNYKVAKLLRKGVNNTNSGGPLKKTTITTASGKPAKQSVSLDHTVAPVENKTNLSHQLFSDTREQEFINTLDLTSEEVNDTIGDVKCSMWQNEKNFPYKQSYPSSPGKDVSKNNEDKQERPRRKRQEPKEFWMLQGTSNKTVNNTNRQTGPKKNTKISMKSDSQNLKLSVQKAKEQATVAEELRECNHESNKVAESGSKRTLRTGRKRKIANVPEKNFCAPDDALSNSLEGKKLKITQANYKFSPLDSHVDTDKESESCKTLLKNTALKKKTDETVFKELNKLSFNDNEMGCSTAQCWNVNNFKCGVFKLKAESQLNCKTLHRNSHLGGVLIKGTLKMKIRDKELELKEGDMAFVPPLTEWQATNIGECESVFYYWCGIFK